MVCKRCSRSTFLAEPEVTIFNETFSAAGVRTQHSFFENENLLSSIRLNGLVEYDPELDRSYVDWWWMNACRTNFIMA